MTQEICPVHKVEISKTLKICYACWDVHVADCKKRGVCYFCDKPSVVVAMGGACQECDNDMCGSQHHE